MEELQSTEILDREILEDARRKAMRILKTADDTVSAQNGEWEKKAATSIEDLEKKHRQQCEFAAGEVMARLPIDKHRVKVEKIENLLQSAVEYWYKSLSRERILELLAAELAKRVALCKEFSASAQKRAIYSALDRKEAETVIKNINGTAVVEEAAGGGYPSVTLETESVRIIASIQNMVDFLLQEKRAELVSALTGSEMGEL